MSEPIKVHTSWAASKEGVERFVAIATALHFGVLASCPGCDDLARVVPLDDRAKSRAAYECGHCGATFAKRSKFTYRVASDNEAAP